jgi:hypothetical protein
MVCSLNRLALIGRMRYPSDFLRACLGEPTSEHHLRPSFGPLDYIPFLPPTPIGGSLAPDRELPSFLQ